MRKVIFLLFMALGAMGGLLATVDERWGLRVLMMAIGMVAGVAIGGALSRIGLRRGSPRRPGAYRAFPSPMFGEDPNEAFLCERGRPRYAKQLPPEPDRHMFDPDKLD